ncbi:MAG: lamin tail domain-containing protein, partial [Marinilabiliaceae bacterium]|nr:lamin tail domain-containing protein [Marinilabiliaceae bacterium]
GPEIDNITSHATNCIKVIFVSNIPNNQTVEFYLEDLYVINGDKIDIGPYQVNINLRDWIGTTDLFNITPSMIQLDAPAVAGEAWLFTESEAVEEAQWQLYFRMYFNPSDQNYCRIYLTADNPDINTINNAYFLVLGTANDNICLWERRNGINRLLITGIHKRLDMGDVWGLIRVTRDENGNFLVESNILNEGWMEEGSYEGSDGMVSNYFGFSCRYTQLRSRHFWFGNFEISGKPYIDTNPPQVVDFEVKNMYSFRLTFSKPIEYLIFDKTNFYIESNGKNPDEINLVENDAYSIDLLYNDAIPINSSHNFFVRNITDNLGNTMQTTFFNFNYTSSSMTGADSENNRTFLLYFNRAINFNTLSPNTLKWKDGGPQIVNVVHHADDCIRMELVTDFPNAIVHELYINDLWTLSGDIVDNGPYPIFIYISKRHDIVISEIFVRTNNSVGLPDSKYIELYNRSEFPIQLADFTIRVNNNSRTLERYLLFPDDYLLIVPSNQNEQWDHVENRIAIVSGFFTSMVVGGGDLVLTDKQGNTMCVLQYNPSMGERGFKTNGGWSLEIIDLDNLSGESNNIDFSIDTIGGTPGRENSISAKNPDVYPPHLIQCYMETDNCLVMEFSETMNPQILPTDCIIEPNDIEIVSMEFEEPFLKNLKINFKQNLPENKTYNFRFVTKPEDLAGNVVSNIDILQFGIPIQPEKGDVIINELLYNPPTDGSMFVELYNRTDNLLDISQLYIARSRGSAVIPEALVQLTDKPISIFPKSYIAFTSNKNWVLHYYDIKDDQTILNISGTMPTFVNTGGSVFLTDIMGNIFERFEYNDKMHFNLLGTTKGVSLERISSEESAMNPQNWHSASADQNYATPGKINSQARSFENIPDKDFLIIEPQVFTPNHDGNDDLLFIRYIFDEPGNNLTITIFNRLGQPVRHITNNSLSGTDGFFTWDGLDDNGQRCPSGIYIVWAKSFNMNGNIKETKKSAVLSYGK